LRYFLSQLYDALFDRILHDSRLAESGKQTFVTFHQYLGFAPMKGTLALELPTMNTLALCVFVQLGLTFGLTGLFWPDKLTRLFDILLYPWAASGRMIRVNSIVAIGLSLLPLVMRLTGNR